MFLKARENHPGVIKIFYSMHFMKAVYFSWTKNVLESKNELGEINVTFQPL